MGRTSTVTRVTEADQTILEPSMYYLSLSVNSRFKTLRVLRLCLPELPMFLPCMFAFLFSVTRRPGRDQARIASRLTSSLKSVVYASRFSLRFMVLRGIGHRNVSKRTKSGVEMIPSRFHARGHEPHIWVGAFAGVRENRC